MTVVDVPIVPAGRLAALLISRRSSRGLTVGELSRMSRGAFSASYLDSVERGAIQLDDESIRAIMSLYELEAGPVVPNRSRLLLDLDQGVLGVGETALSLSSSTGHHVLERYVSLLYLLRGETPGRKLTLRDEDLLVLQHSLGRQQEELANQLFAIMGAQETKQRTALLSKRTVVIGAGLLVGATAIGALVIVGSNESSNAIDSMMPAKTEIVSNVASSGDVSATFASFAGASADSEKITVIPLSQGSGLPEVAATVASDTAPIQALDNDPLTIGSASMADDVVEDAADHAPVEAAISAPQVDRSVRQVQAVADADLADIDLADAEASNTQSVETDLSQPDDQDHAALVDHAQTDHAQATVAPPSTQVAEAAVAAPTNVATTPAQLGAAAEGLINYNFRSVLPNWTISYTGDNASYQGMTNSRAKTIVVYVEPGDTAYDVAEVLMHEVGHAIDVEYLDDTTRRQWIELRNMPSVWWAGDGLSDFAVGAGDFAEAIAAVTTGSPSNSVYGGFTAAQLDFARAQLR